MPELPLRGLRILLLEDEALIALDVEQMCQDAGASDVTIISNLDQLARTQVCLSSYDAAIVDVMLQGTSTVDQARMLVARGVPFIFATGHSESADLFSEFPDVPIVGKPYSGSELIDELARAAGRNPTAG